MAALDPTNTTSLMQRALELARNGVSLASPNPMVGAVVVRDGRIVGEGYHTYDERKHAEVKALEQAGEAARGATLIVNLEPCCHTGRTGPCTDAIIAAGVTHVVAAMTDPNRAVSGKGFQRLREAGITVETGVRRDEAERLNEAFSKYIQTGLPLVTLKSAMTLDGKIAGPDDNSGWITSEEARAHVQQQRHEHDAILTGVGTVVADDPLLTDRSGLPRRRPLLRIVMDSKLRIPLNSRMLSQVQDDLIIFCEEADAEKRSVLEQRGVRLYVGDAAGSNSASRATPADRPDLNRVLSVLAAEHQVTSVLLEAGAELNWAALEAGGVDKVFLYYAPKILGGHEALPLAGGPGIRSMHDALPIKNVRLHRFGPDFAVEGYLREIYPNDEQGQIQFEPRL